MNTPTIQTYLGAGIALDQRPKAALAARPRSAWLGLHRKSVGPPKARLLILPFAGGNASAFFPWMQETAAASWLELVVVQPPGRGPRFRDPPLDDLHDYAKAVADLVSDLVRNEGQAPLFILGYSMGALVGYLTSRDAGHHLNLQHLFVAARKAPSHHRPAGSPPRQKMPREAVLARLRRLQGTPEAVLRNPDLINPYLDSIATEFHLVDSYAGSNFPTLDVPITAISGLRDPETPVDQVFGWQDQTSREFSAHFLQGGHFFMNTARPALQRLVVQTISQTINGDLP